MKNNTFSYNPSEYRRLIRFSHRKRLLVEGKEDKRLFKILLDELKNNDFQEFSKDSIDIDTAENLINFENIVGNREKVEAICQSIENEAYANKLAGFVDREFREFDINPMIQDNLNFHKVLGRLVWSRGHSIENYFFDFSILRDPLRDLSATEWFDDALIIFEQLIELTLRLACAASLTGKELGRLNLIKNSITWKVIEVNNSSVILLLDDWKRYLIDSQKLTVKETETIISRYTYWYKLIDSTDFQVVRWMCHGHIGIAVIWAVYSRCVYYICRQSGVAKPEVEVSKVQAIKEENRTQACASWWARKAIGSYCDYPIEVFKLLGLFFS